MQLRTQLAIVGVIAAGWAAGNFAVVHPVLAESPNGQRRSLARLEAQVAQDSDNVVAARALSQRYLDLDMPRLAVETIGRMSRAVQEDGRVTLNVARAYELLGDMQTASARLNGAMNRCAAIPQELAAGSGCDIRTQTEIMLELTAVDRMIAWNVTPATDPERAQMAHDLALRPITLAGPIQ